MASRSFRRPLPAKELRWRCSPSRFGVESTAEAEPLVETIGQDEALAAMRLALQIDAPGYNLYVAGLPGLGKTSLVQGLLDEITASCPLPPDRIYVNNFGHPERPHLIQLPRGVGAKFAQDVARAGDAVAESIKRTYDDEAYAKQREEIAARYREEERKLIDAFEKDCADRGFAPGAVQAGSASEPDVFYVIGNQGVAMGDIDAAIRAGSVKPEQEEGIRAAHRELRSEMAAMMRRVRLLAAKRQADLETLERKVARRMLEEVGSDLEAEFPYPPVKDHLARARVHFAERFPIYVRSLLAAAEQSSGRDDTYRLAAEELLREFRVNLLLDGSTVLGCPVVIEQQPTWTNLFGQIEREVDPRGNTRTDFLMIRAGSLLRADGGYLVLQVRDLLAEEGVWAELKRVLKHGQLKIRASDAQAAQSPVVLDPEPIPVSVKVVLIGDEGSWYMLREADPEFADIFKVKATFERDTPLTDHALRRYASFFHKLSRAEHRLHLDKSGLAAVAEEGVREAGRQGHLSVRFGRLSDLVREADQVARTEAASRISAEHVRLALAAEARRRGVEERRVREAIREGVILLQTNGTRVGQVNGLAVYDFGDHRFGKVARITAAVGAGQAGLVNVERLAELSGSSHDKGVLILSGYLRSTFGADRALAFTASLVFEQSYGGVEGDSATCAEAFAILSALARAPVRQDLAVTGSMNQHGDVQAVGGVNDKVEGFYDLCAERGLTGTQGVIIPSANAKDLMLRLDVVEACREGRFSVYAIDRVEQGFELLTGRKSGASSAPGKFVKGSLYADVAARLAALADARRPGGAPTAPDS